MRPRISIKGSVRPYVRPSVDIKGKPPKATISACETHRITRLGLFFVLLLVVDLVVVVMVVAFLKRYASQKNTAFFEAV